MAEVPGNFEKDQTFTHEELLKINSSVLTELLLKDPYLADLPSDVTVDEVNNHISVLHGKSITVYVLRGSEWLPVIVPQSGSKVQDLKRAIRRCIDLKLSRMSSHYGRHKISWRYVWRTYNLECNNSILEDDNMLLQSAGVAHKSKITFVKRRRRKNVP